ncbi:MAG: metallophosphoesterase [archaeon]
MGEGFLLDKEMLGLISGLSDEGVKRVIEIFRNLKIEERVINKNLLIGCFEKLETLLRIKLEDDEIYSFFKKVGYCKKSDIDSKVVEEKGKVKLISAPAFFQKKIEVKDFIKHFRARYEVLKGILESKNLDNLTSIRKIEMNRGSHTIIAAVFKKRMTKNKNLFLEVEDLTGNIIVLVNQNKKEVFKKAKDLLNDDIVAFSVSGTSEMLFANDVIFPEAGLVEKRYSEFDEYVAFSGDFHIGSTMFLEKNLLRFVEWLNGTWGDEKQKAIAKKVKYLFLLGDNIDGVNHYPGQEKYLIEKTSEGQYKKVEEILRLIREDIRIIMCPGQHDAVWVGEPQPIIGERFAKGLHEMKNLSLVPNPSLVEIDGGFRILMYHGASINQFIEEIPEIRVKFGHNSPTRVVKEMLKRRHLAPIHGVMDYIPCEQGDSLVIDKIPDIIATADQHRAEVSIFNNILMIASSCWQSITPFEEKVGNVPDPCKVPLFNLKTREIKMLDFSDELKEIEWENGGELSCNLKEDESLNLPLIKVGDEK